MAAVVGGGSADDLSDGGAQGVLIFRIQDAELTDHQTLFEGGEDGLDSGTLTGDGSLTYAYDPDNKIFSVSNGSTQAYDGAGRLFSVGSGGATRFLYDGDEAIAEYGASGQLLRRYVFGPATDEPLTWYEGAYAGAVRYGLVTDRLGSVVAVTGDSGTASAINSYDEYGIAGASNQGRFGFTGQMNLPEFGLYSYKARNYSPTLGRFVQPDPIGYGDGPNFYQYAGSDPVNGSDPSGTLRVVPGESFGPCGMCELFGLGDGIHDVAPGVSDPLPGTTYSGAPEPLNGHYVGIGGFGDVWVGGTLNLTVPSSNASPGTGSENALMYVPVKDTSGGPAIKWVLANASSAGG